MQRFKTRPQFQAALAGELIAKTSHFALHRVDIRQPLAEQKSPLFPSSDTWMGAMAPKRWAKRAVTRNAIKRQIYTVSDSLTSQLPAAAFLVRLRREFSRNDYVSASSAALKDAARAQLQVLMQSAFVQK
jgi:ribonuclease P protein component